MKRAHCRWGGFLVFGLAVCANLADAADEFSIDIQSPDQLAKFSVYNRGAKKSDLVKWKDYFSAMFDFADRNRDGTLDEREAANVPPSNLLLAIWRGDFDNLPAGSVTFAKAKKTSEETQLISKAEFIAYFHKQQIHLPELQSQPNADSLQSWESRWLFEQLAAPETECSAESFRTASRRMRRFDTNDDERWSIDEIRHAARLDRAKSDETRNVKPPPKVSLVPIHTFGEEFKQRKYSGGEFSYPEFMEDTPENPRGYLALSKPRMGGKVDKKPSEMALLGIRGQSNLGQLILSTRFAIGDGLARFATAHQSMAQQFEIDDLNHDDKLDREELERSPQMEAFTILRKIADRDDDGRLSLNELNDFMKLQMLIVERWVTVTVADVGPPLFDTLDLDGDGAISLRELTHGWLRVQSWDGKDPAGGRSQDGRVTWNDIPYQLNFTFSYGPPRKRDTAKAESNSAVAAPVWFQKMDRNGDGDVSRREFLGAAEVFRTIDVDGDELISPLESEAARKP